MFWTTVKGVGQVLTLPQLSVASKYAEYEPGTSTRVAFICDPGDTYASCAGPRNKRMRFMPPVHGEVAVAKNITGELVVDPGSGEESVSWAHAEGANSSRSAKTKENFSCRGTSCVLRGRRRQPVFLKSCRELCAHVEHIGLFPGSA